ncbi:hypothetical protein [Nocardioides ultimimeridianus]
MTTRIWRRAVVSLGASAVAAAVCSSVLLDRTGALHAAADGNSAVADRAATSQVVQAVRADLAAVLSYDYRHPDRPRKAASQVLVGDALHQYDRLYGALAGVGRQQRLVYRGSLLDVGVQRLTGTDAQLLVFMNQMSTRGTDGAVNVAPTQIKVAAQHLEGTWKISSIELL